MTVWVCFVRMFESVQWLASVCVRFYHVVTSPIRMSSWTGCGATHCSRRVAHVHSHPCDGLGLLCSNVRVCSVVGVSMCEILPRGNISNTNEQLDRVWRHSLFQKSGPRA